MKISKNTFWNLIILFEIILLIKFGISFFQDKPFLFSDEPCVLLRAKNFAKYFAIEPCESLSKIPSGDPHPLYSMLLSVIYLFTSGMKAYRGALFLNSLLVASLVFPLFGIFKRFIKENKAIFTSITLILFLTPIIIYEKTVLTECLFFVVNIWFLHFYIKSFEKNKTRNKLLALLFSIISALTRPFGFITITAMAINEIIVQKKKKITILFLPLAITVFFIVTKLYLPNIFTSTVEKFASLNELENWKNIFFALIQQINSFTIVTLFIPLVIFVTYINKKDSKTLNNIRFYLLIFIFLNFIISAQHIYGYFLKNNDPGLITRYINSSVILIFIFSFIFFLRYKKFKLTKTNIITIIVLIFSFLFFKDEGVKNSLNLDLWLYHKTEIPLFGPLDFVESKHYIGRYFLPFIFIFSVLLIKNKRKIFITASIIVLITYSLLTTVWQSNYLDRHPITNYFLNKQNTITAIIDNVENVYLVHIWELLSLTNNDVKLVVIDYSSQRAIDTQLNTETLQYSSTHFNEGDYILTEHELDLQKVYKAGAIYVYKNEENPT